LESITDQMRGAKVYSQLELNKYTGDSTDTNVLVYGINNSFESDGVMALNHHHLQHISEHISGVLDK